MLLLARKRECLTDASAVVKSRDVTFPGVSRSISGAGDAHRYNWSMSSSVPISLPPGARAALLAPSVVTRAVAVADRDPERRWMLRLPRPVRRSFVAEVLDAGADQLLQERWMLLQSDDVRESYVEDVLLQFADPDTRAVWLLRQDRAVRESYVAEVIDGRDPRGVV
jgi:hypothetical protein